MKKKEEQHQRVKDFFNDISSEYHQKYQNKNPFLHYFFQQRLTEATSHFSFEKKTILDIGAGTAPLYYHLKNSTHQFQYFATDISPKMLEASGLPNDLYFVGNISDDFPFPEKKYDFIFLLGVTTYFSPTVLNQHLQFIQNHLSKNGIAIISFTNKSSIDFKIRKIVSKISSLFKLKKSVLGQKFKIFAYSPKELNSVIPDLFAIKRQIFLNQTIPPFNRIFPKTSISLAHFFKKKISSPLIISWLSSDFMIFLESKSNIPNN